MLRGELLPVEFAQPPQQRLHYKQIETAAAAEPVAVSQPAPLAASTSFAETASVETAAARRHAEPPSAPDPSPGLGHTDQRDRDRSERVRSSRARSGVRSHAPTINLDDLDEGELTVPRLRTRRPR